MSDRKHALPVVLDFYRNAGTAAAAAASAQGFPCSDGCANCCSQPVLVNDSDVRVIQHGLRLLEPSARATLEERARTYRDELAADGLDVSPDGPVRQGLRRAAHAVMPIVAAGWKARPCPALDVATGRCGIYDHRPMTCRLHYAMGPEACAVGAPGRLPVLDATKAWQRFGATFQPQPVGLLGLVLADEADRTLIAV